MTLEAASDLLRQLIFTSLTMVSPILITAMGVGVVVSLMQSITSIQEQTLTFVPKLVLVGVVLVAVSPWIMRMGVELGIRFFSQIPEMTR